VRWRDRKGGKGESFVKKRSIISLVAGGLIAAMLPGVAVAQTEAEGDLIFSGNVTCEFGQGSVKPLPPCEADENGVVTLTMTNPQDRSGPFDGFQFLEAEVQLDTTDGTFEATGYSYFAGEVEGCGSGTVYFDWEAVGATGDDGLPGFETNRYTSVPGGTLAVTATIDELVTETPNGDGTSFIPYTVTYSCDEA
jgi:hypothetical protein